MIWVDVGGSVDIKPASEVGGGSVDIELASVEAGSVVTGDE